MCLFAAYGYITLKHYELLHDTTVESINLTNSRKTLTTILYTAAILARSDFRVCGNKRGSANCQRALFIPQVGSLQCEFYPCVIHRFY
jgi:hypothetical protein